MAKVKRVLVIAAAILLLGVTATVLTRKLVERSGARHGRLLDGSAVVLEALTYGKTHLSPTSPPPGLMRWFPAKWLQKFNWKSGTAKTSNQKSDIYVFWLKFDNPQGDKDVTYAIADENGVEAPVPFNGPNWAYDAAGFGTNRMAVARSFSWFPHRSNQSYLRLYQKSAKGDLVRIANFPVQSTQRKDIPTWIPSVLPILQETNGFVFSLENAVVGITPREEVVPPYDSYPGDWSEFRFQVTERTLPSTGWRVDEIWIQDAAGNRMRTSRQDKWSLNGTFSRNENDSIVCIHRWPFWRDEPAWKLRVRFEHEMHPEFWAEYLVKPDFLP